MYMYDVCQSKVDSSKTAKQ